MTNEQVEVNRIIVGNNIETLKTLPDGCVHMCVTSPPYYGLRDYQTADWVGGNDPNCDHVANSSKTKLQNNPEFDEGRPSREATKLPGYYYDSVCEKCGAVKEDHQLGMESTPEEFISNLVNVFREVKRVLRDDGTLWVNIGDSYAGANGNGYKQSIANENASTSGGHYNEDFRKKMKRVDTKCKPKDLIGIPWMLAFALRADGWYLRQDIIWKKENCMPESVKDRCTKNHEYIFLLAKSQQYYFDNDSIREPLSKSSIERVEYGWDCDRPSTKNNSLGDGEGIHTDKMGSRFANPLGRNKRSVWTTTLQPFREAHFATYPEKLIEPCILAGCPEGGVVLDPFMGSGTTAVVALKNGRNYLGCELNPDYAEIAKKRIEPVFQTVQDTVTNNRTASEFFTFE